MIEISKEILRLAGSKAEYFHSDLLKEDYCKITHKSKLEIYVFPKKFRNTFALFATKYGSLHSEFKKFGDKHFTIVPDGIAHFLEHKVFANPDGSDEGEFFASIGAEVNAYTSYNKTAYLCSCTENFDKAFRELINFVTHPYFSEESVEKEKSIIAEEIGMYDDNPDEACFMELLRALYRKNSVRNNICGDKQSILKITPGLLYECYNTFYTPSNMVISVCGNVNAEEILKAVDENLPESKCDIHKRVILRKHKDSANVFKKSAVKYMQVSKPIFNIGIKDVNISKDPLERIRKDAGMTILNEIIFSRSGDFFNRLYESSRLSSSYSYGYSITKDFALNIISGETDDPMFILAQLQKYISDLQKSGISKEIFERSKKIIYSDFIRSFDSTDEIANDLLGFVFDECNIFEYPKVIENITYEYATELLNTMFNPNSTSISIIYPTDSKIKSRKDD